MNRIIDVYSRSEIDPAANISKHFKWKEWLCSCGKCDIQYIHYDIANHLEVVRDLLDGVPIVITSGYRCPAYNAKVGGAPASRHMRGDGADIKASRRTPVEVARAADEAGFTGIKIYSSWTHVDLRDGVWKPNLPWTGKE